MIFVRAAGRQPRTRSQLSVLRSKVSHSPQLGDSSDFDPFNYKDIPFPIEARAVRTDELARDERLAGLSAQRMAPRSRIGISQMTDDLVVPVHQRYPPLQVWNHHGAFVFVEVTRQPESWNEVDVFAFGGKPL